MNSDDMLGEQGFLELAKQLPEPEEEGYFNSVADYGKTLLKGSIEGLSRFGRMFGPLITEESEEELQSQLTEQLEELLPTDEGFIQKGLRRGLQQMPTMAAFPGAGVGTLPRSVAAGFAGQSAEELGAPEWAQSAAEISAFIGPDLTKKLLEKGKNKDIIKAARDLGLQDEQIAPLIQSEFKKKWLSKLAPAKGRTQEILNKTKSSLGESLNSLKGSAVATGELAAKDQEVLLKKLSEVAMDMPSVVREKVAQDFIDLTRRPITGDSLINLYKDINKNINPNTRELFLFKDPIRESLHKISPELGSNFDSINNLFSRYYDISHKLKPTLVGDLVKAGEALGILGSITTGNTPALQALLAEKGLKIGARELLLNPRLSQLSEKFMLALNQQKYGVASKISKSINKELKGIDDSIEIDEFSEEDLKNILGG